MVLSSAPCALITLESKVKAPLLGTCILITEGKKEENWPKGVIALKAFNQMWHVSQQLTPLARASRLTEPDVSGARMKTLPSGETASLMALSRDVKSFGIKLSTGNFHF